MCTCTQIRKNFRWMRNTMNGIFQFLKQMSWRYVNYSILLFELWSALLIVLGLWQNTSAVTTPFILCVVTKDCKRSIQSGIRTCYDKLEYKIKINYVTLMCMYTHSLPRTTARVVTAQHLRSIHCIILMLSLHTCRKLWIWKVWKQDGFWIRVFWDVMPWHWVNCSSVIIIEKGNQTD
jgi:hypothetical protein